MDLGETVLDVALFHAPLCCCGGRRGAANRPTLAAAADWRLRCLS